VTSQKNTNHVASRPSEFPSVGFSVFRFYLGAYKLGWWAEILESLNEVSK